MMMDLMNDVMSRWSRTIRVFILQLIVLGLGLYDTFFIFLAFWPNWTFLIIFKW